jgi:phage terminase large subunit-like protein
MPTLRARIDWLAARAGTKTQALITTTPRRLAVLRRILDEPSTVRTNDTTYANQAQLPRDFLGQIYKLYKHTSII